jgi:hypothetical protein
VAHHVASRGLRVELRRPGLILAINSPPAHAVQELTFECWALSMNTPTSKLNGTKLDFGRVVDDSSIAFRPALSIPT